MPAIPAPTIQTSTWIFWSSEGAEDLFVVADQIERLSREPVGCFDTGFWALRLWLRALVAIPILRSIACWPEVPFWNPSRGILHRFASSRSFLDPRWR